MTLLANLRQSPRWLVLLVGFAALAVTTAALVPHEEGAGEDLDCLVCKAGHQPLTELSVELLEKPPAARPAAHPTLQIELEHIVAQDTGAPRAPPT